MYTRFIDQVNADKKTAREAQEARARRRNTLMFVSIVGLTAVYLISKSGPMVQVSIDRVEVKPN